MIQLKYGVFITIPNGKQWENVLDAYNRQKSEMDKSTVNEMDKLINIHLKNPFDRHLPYRVTATAIGHGMEIDMDDISLPDGGINVIMPHAAAYVRSMGYDLSCRLMIVT